MKRLTATIRIFLGFFLLAPVFIGTYFILSTSTELPELSMNVIGYAVTLLFFVGFLVSPILDFVQYTDDDENIQ